MSPKGSIQILGYFNIKDGRNNPEIASKIAEAKKEFSENEINNHKQPHLNSYKKKSPGCMDARPGQFQIGYKRNWWQQKCDFFGECYESHGLQRNQKK